MTFGYARACNQPAAPWLGGECRRSGRGCRMANISFDFNRNDNARFDFHRNLETMGNQRGDVTFDCIARIHNRVFKGFTLRIAPDE